MFFNNINKVIYVDGMKCSHCADKVKESLLKINNVNKVKVDLKNKSVKIYSKIDLDNSIITKCIEDIGFTIIK